MKVKTEMPRAAQTMLSAFPRARLRALDGHVELAVAEAAGSDRSRPARVSGIIGAMYREIGGEEVDTDTVRRVSAAGREWLLQRAALRFFGGAHWFETVCDVCGAKLDLQFSLKGIPHTAPGPSFPVAEIMTSMGPRAFEVPNGGHEEAFTEFSESDPRRVFAALCGLSDEAEAEAIRFNEHDLVRIDTGLEITAPEIADGVDVVCPECSARGYARIDPLAFAFPEVSDVLREVHTIASVYHWPEEMILDLPLPRRRAYAGLIRGGGQTGNPPGRRMS